jgi:predicted  nucleic acid-binding Zn-ribbon protein
VRDELPFLRQENERLGLLLDNRDDMLREAKKIKKELRASLEDARTRVAELETQNLDAKLERTLMSPRGGGVNRRDDQIKLFLPKHLS